MDSTPTCADAVRQERLRIRRECEWQQRVVETAEDRGSGRKNRPNQTWQLWSLCHRNMALSHGRPFCSNHFELFGQTVALKGTRDTESVCVSGSTDMANFTAYDVAGSCVMTLYTLRWPVTCGSAHAQTMYTGCFKWCHLSMGYISISSGDQCRQVLKVEQYVSE